jgi:uncharacterized protein (DUF2141 family)
MKSVCVVVFVAVLVVLSFFSCAKTGRPTGGPEDEDPPVAEKYTPQNETTNFTSDEIKISFNEYIKLKDVNTQLIVSPPLKYPPVITPLGTPSKYIKIKILDTLKQNTTYTFNFGQSIIDNTEGNILNNFKYVFSTGDVIDSLSIKGTITDAFKEEADKNVSILLYEMNEQFNDSTIYKEKPLYVANTLDTTSWEITNIKEGNYLLVALNDASKNYIFNPKEDKIGFIKKEIKIPTEEVYELTLFEEILPYKLVRPSVASNSHIIFGYEGIGDSIVVKPLRETPELKSLAILEKETDTLNYWYKGIERDSLLFIVKNKKRQDTVNVRLLSKVIDSLNFTNSTKGILLLRDQYKLMSNIPLVSIDTSKVRFMDKDSVKVPYNVTIGTLLKEIIFDFTKKHNDSYRIEIMPEAIKDFLGHTNDSLTIRFKTKQPSDYGSVYFTLQNVKSYPIIVELLDAQGDIVESIYATQEQEFPFVNLNPAKYKMRVIYDTNSNGKWDTGDYLQRLQPESVIYYPIELNIRANWDPKETFILKE